MKIYGPIEKAQLESIATASEPAFGVVGRIWWNTNTGFVRVDSGTALLTLLDTNSTQTVTNKTFSGASNTFTNLSLTTAVTGVLPIANGGTNGATLTAGFNNLAPTTTAGDLIVHNGTNNVRLAVGSDGQTIVVDTSQTNKLKWATLPQGNKNYITYNNFENNATTGWHKATVTLSSSIPTGAPTVDTASSITTFASTATTPLAGTYSLQVAASSGFTAGQGIISDAYTIDREDRAKVMGFKFYYEANTLGTGYNFSGTSSNTFAIYFYSEVDSTWIQPAGVYSMTQAVGVGYASGTFQTPANMTSFRILVVAINATSSNTDIEFDDFSVGPQATSYSIQKAPTQQRFTSSSGTYTTPGGVSYIRVRMVGGGGGGGSGGTAAVGSGSSGGTSTFGSSLLTATGGGGGGQQAGSIGTATIASPAIGTAISGSYGPNEITLTTGTYQTGGHGGSSPFGGNGKGGWNGGAGTSAAANSGSGGGGGVVTPGGTVGYAAAGGSSGGYLEAFIISPSSSYSYAVGAAGAGAPAATNGTVGGDGGSGYIEVTEYYAADVATNTDADTREISARAKTSAATVISTGNTIVFGTVDYDSNGSYASGTGIYTVQVSGKYKITALIQAASFTPSAGNFYGLDVDKNGGGRIARLCLFTANAAIAQNVVLSGSTELQLIAGDTIKILANISSGTITLNGDATTNWLTIERLSGPAVVAASESVSASYEGATTTVGTSASTIVFPTKINDSHNAMNSSTGVYTVPVSGRYRVTISWFGSGTVSSTTAGHRVYTSTQKSGGTDYYHGNGFVYQVTGVSMSTQGTGHREIQCVAGDTLINRIQRDSGISSFSLSGTTGYTWVDITRIGN